MFFRGKKMAPNFFGAQEKIEANAKSSPLAFFHPDCTVGAGVPPALSPINRGLAGSTADRGISPRPESSNIIQSKKAPVNKRTGAKTGVPLA
jgi:hypothetical protein